jgi:glycerophosphoryl diester phosphodiesterase
MGAAPAIASSNAGPHPRRRPLVVAHKGYSARAPENTLAAVRLAVAHEVDMVEIDVHATLDGVPVVLHDKTLDRTTTGAGPVRDWPFDRLRAGVHIQDCPGERVPTLAEVLDLTLGRAALAIEIKAPGVTDAVLELVRRLGAEAQVAIWSFHSAVVRRTLDEAPEIDCAFLHHGSRNGSHLAVDAFVDEAASMGAPGVSFFPEDIQAASVRRAHELGLRVFTGTVNTPDECLRVTSAGVDGVVTDEPLGMQSWLAARSARLAANRPRPVAWAQSTPHRRRTYRRPAAYRTSR